MVCREEEEEGLRAGIYRGAGGEYLSCGHSEYYVRTQMNIVDEYCVHVQMNIVDTDKYCRPR